MADGELCLRFEPAVLALGSRVNEVFFVVKEASIQYLKRARGTLWFTGRVASCHLEEIQNAIDHGGRIESVVPVAVSNDMGEEVVTARFTCAIDMQKKAE